MIFMGWLVDSCSIIPLLVPPLYITVSSPFTTGKAACYFPYC